MFPLYQFLNIFQYSIIFYFSSRSSIKSIIIIEIFCEYYQINLIYECSGKHAFFLGNGNLLKNLWKGERERYSKGCRQVDAACTTTIKGILMFDLHLVQHSRSYLFVLLAITCNVSSSKSCLDSWGTLEVKQLQFIIMWRDFWIFYISPILPESSVCLFVLDWWHVELTKKDNFWMLMCFYLNQISLKVNNFVQDLFQR